MSLGEIGNRKRKPKLKNWGKEIERIKEEAGQKDQGSGLSNIKEIRGNRNVGPTSSPLADNKLE